MSPMSREQMEQAANHGAPYIHRPAQPDIDYDLLAEKIAEKALTPNMVAQASGNGGTGNWMGPSAYGGQSAYAIQQMPSTQQGQQTAGAVRPPAPLPRSPFNTYDAQFGPGWPLWPAPLDAPAPGAIRPDPRRTEYPVAINIQLLDREIPWPMLKRLSKTDVLRRAIELSIDTVLGLDWDFTVTPTAVRAVQSDDDKLSYAQASRIVQKKYSSEIDRVRTFWESPDKGMVGNGTWSGWMTAALTDQLTFDAIAVYPKYNLDKTLRAFELVDGSTIKLYRDDRGRTPQFPNPAFGQILYGFVRGEWQHFDGETDDTFFSPQSQNVPDEFMRDQLAYYMRRPGNWNVYGFSTVEECIQLALIYMGRLQWLSSEYTDGAMPQAYVRTANGNSAAWTAQQWNAYEEVLNSQLSGITGNRKRLKLLMDGMEIVPIPTEAEKYKIDYDAHLITQIASRFGVSPNQLGIQPKSGLGGGKQLAAEQDLTETVSQKPMQEFVVDLVNDLSIRFLGMDRAITLTFNGGTNIEDEVNKANANKTLVSVGLKTINDLRGDAGDPLFDIPEADQPMIVTATGPVFLSTEFQAAQQSALGPKTPPPGAPNAADGQEPPSAVGGAESPAGTPDESTTGAAAKPGASTTNTDGSVKVPPKGKKPKPKGKQPPPKGGAVSTDDGGSGATGAASPDAAAEAGKFLRFARMRTQQHRPWRNWKFEHIDPVLGDHLNELGRSGDMMTAKVIAEEIQNDWMVVMRGKAAARETPGHELREKLETHYAAKLAETFRQALRGTHAAIHAARALAGKAAVGVDAATPSAQGAAAHLAIDAGHVTKTLTDLYHDSFNVGAHAGAANIPNAKLPTSTAGINWDTWKPGFPNAAAQVEDQGLADLLDAQGDTVSGISDSMIGQLGNYLAGHLSSGSSVDEVAAGMEDVVGNVDGRAMTIARTEVARGMSAGNEQVYGDNGVTQVELVTTEPCEECEAIEAQNPWDYDDPDRDTVPIHPNCRCAWVASQFDNAGVTPVDGPGTDDATPDGTELLGDGANKYTQETYDLAGPMVADATKAEPEVTAALSAVAADANGNMVGLQYAVKGQASLARKLYGDGLEKGIPPDQVKVYDVLRYTTTFERDDYTAGVSQMADDLKAKGYTFDPARVKDTWGSRVYRGINTTVTSPDGQQFELQFHTPESFNVKEVLNHPLYEEARLPDTTQERQDELAQLMANNAGRLGANPPGWDAADVDKMFAPLPDMTDAVSAVATCDPQQMTGAEIDAFADQYPELTKAQADAIYQYSGSTAGDINGHLRDGTALGKYSNVASQLDSAMAPSPADALVSRLIASDVFNITSDADVEALVGQVVSDAGFMSTTMYSPTKFLSQFASNIDGLPVALKIAVPRGTPSVAAMLHSAEDEAELLLARDTKLAITGWEPMEMTDGSGSYILHATVVPT